MFGRGKDKKKRKRRAIKNLVKTARMAEGRAISRAAKGLSPARRFKAANVLVKDTYRGANLGQKAGKKLGLGRRGQRQLSVAGAEVGARIGVVRGLSTQQASRLRDRNNKRVF